MVLFPQFCCFFNSSRKAGFLFALISKFHISLFAQVDYNKLLRLHRIFDMQTIFHRVQTVNSFIRYNHSNIERDIDRKCLYLFDSVKRQAMFKMVK